MRTDDWPAGFGYAFEDEKLAEFSRPIGFDDFSGEAIDTANRPLVNQPGETFQYGVSLDWVGVIIERTYNKSLEEVFKEKIFQPLGMDHVTFHPSQEDKRNLAYMHRRSPGGKLSTTDHFYRRPLVAQDGEKVPCAGGHGCFGRPTEFGRKFRYHSSCSLSRSLYYRNYITTVEQWHGCKIRSAATQS